jgi:predicted RNA binding protein YcfA (HicA-like mRNA interferase family)
MMTKRDKLIERMRRDPRSIRFDEIETLLLSLGFVKRQKGSSHVVFTLGSSEVVVPFRKPTVKPVYVQLVLALLDEIEDSRED